MFAEYKIDKEIGKEPLGALYLAHGPGGRPVVIKTLALATEFDPRDQAEIRKRFTREAKAAARLRHPGIRRVFSSGEQDGTAWMAMETVTGNPLSQSVSRYDLLPVPVLLDLIARAADALHYAHGENVVHQDIKPANILYDPQSGNIKITDFGFAHFSDPGRTRTCFGMTTPSFKSPEQLADGAADPASDLFSLGVTLYQLLTARLPFQSDSMLGLMQSIIDLPHLPPTEARSDLDPALDWILARALQKRPEDRFADGAQMASALRACVGAMAG